MEKCRTISRHYKLATSPRVVWMRDLFRVGRRNQAKRATVSLLFVSFTQYHVMNRLASGISILWKTNGTSRHRHDVMFIVAPESNMFGTVQIWKIHSTKVD